MRFEGVMPAITTPFDERDAIDHAFLARHARWLVERGCSGIVAFGSLGEGATLEAAERDASLETLAGALGGSASLVAAVSALGTRQAVRLAEAAARRGCTGLMVLPPYVHRGAWRETRAHLAAVLDATALPCMLYNNPAAYGVDLLPEQIAELAAAHPTLVALKDSGGDHRRLTAVRALVPGLALLAGLDDMPLEAVFCGAAGWVAGLANALPDESVRLLALAREGRWDEAWALYRWFLPLLRLDTVPEFVQLIKLVQQEVGVGSERVRPPRLPLEGTARAEALVLIRGSLARRPGGGS